MVINDVIGVKEMIKVVEDQCGMEDGKFVVVLESESSDELYGGQPVKIATDAAFKMGLGSLCLTSQTAPMPVNEEGKVPSDYSELVKLANTKGCKYQKRVYLVQRF